MAENKAKSVVVLESDEDFGGEARSVAGKPPKKRKSKKKQDLKGPEKMVLDMSKKWDKATTEYRLRHEESNRKKSNGWIKDLGKNYSKALGKLF